MRLDGDPWSWRRTGAGRFIALIFTVLSGAKPESFDEVRGCREVGGTGGPATSEAAPLLGRKKKKREQAPRQRDLARPASAKPLSKLIFI